MEPNDGNTGDVAQCHLRDNPPPCPTVSEVWDSPMIEKYNDPTCGQKRWRCHHCKHTFGSWNATKALAHVTKKKGKNIQICQGKYTQEYKNAYSDLDLVKKTKKDQKVQHADEVAVAIREHQQDSLHHFPQVKRARTRNGPLLSRRLSIAVESSPTVASLSSVSTITKTSTIASAHHPRETIIVDGDRAEKLEKRKPNWVQTSVSKTAPVNSDLKEKTDIAIVHLIHARCLPFDISGDALFSKMCTLIRATNGTYVPPNRHQVSGHLLNSLYKAHMQTTKASLITDAELYGLTA
mmetsp:Transcript_27744/g.57712  ORF Transcript_27744/g.57712 Transcript_27744/m.57712 type:complete len:294 (+) Transcript_27744:108-989(+)